MQSKTACMASVFVITVFMKLFFRKRKRGVQIVDNDSALWFYYNCDKKGELNASIIDGYLLLGFLFVKEEYRSGNLKIGTQLLNAAIEKAVELNLGKGPWKRNQS